MKVYVEAYGCSQNIAETMMLARAMGELVEAPENADIILIGTCIVIEHTENRMLRRISELKKYRKKIVVYGCLPSARNEILKFDNDIITVRTWEFEKAKKILNINNSPLEFLYEKDSIATIPIANGCLGNCTYCITRIARGILKSRDEEWILKMAKNAVEKGIKEIRLSAQDTAAYGKDQEKNLAELINRITSIDGDFRLRIGMMEPKETLDIVDSLVDSYHSDKVFKFLHIPVQSGDNYILEKMGRGYKVEDFKYIVEKFRKNFPNITISTDIITGFPGEDDESFEKTYNLIKEIKPDILNITRFSPRPKTPAYKWKKVSSNTAKLRSKKLTELHFSILSEKNKKFLGKEFKVVITSHGKRGNFLGRTDEYKPVILNDVKIGEFYKIKIISMGRTYFVGKIIN